MINDARHPNAEAHAKVMEDLRRRSPRQVFETLVEAGIYTPNGELTAPYRADNSNGVRRAKKKLAKRK
jgi:hypothetical protein